MSSPGACQIVTVRTTAAGNAWGRAAHMIDESDAYEPLGADSDPVAWSRSYILHPTVLFPWLACAALSALLRDHPQQMASPRETPLPRRPVVVSAPRMSELGPGRHGDSDDEARAA